MIIRWNLLENLGEYEKFVWDLGGMLVKKFIYKY